MKIKVLFFIAILGATIFLEGCSSPNPTPNPIKGKYESGVLIINEGGFGSNNGDVTYYNPSTFLLEQTIYRNANGGTLFAGDVLQSMTLDKDKAYLVLNGSNKIEIVDNKTFKHVSTFTAPALDKPRYLQVINDKAYVSVWGPYDSNFALIDSYVLVVDIQTLKVTDTLDTDEGVENLLYNGNYLFGSNFNYGASSTVAVINPTNNTVVDQIELAPGPAGMVLDINKKLWVITTGISNDGKLFRVNPTTLAIEDHIDLSVTPGVDLGISPDGKNLIYNVGNSVYKLSIDATTAPTDPWFTVTDMMIPYALGADPATGEVYFGDAIDYSSEGLVYVYSAEGVFKKSLSAGIAPGQFIFRK